MIPPQQQQQQQSPSNQVMGVYNVNLDTNSTAPLGQESEVDAKPDFDVAAVS